MKKLYTLLDSENFVLNAQYFEEGQQPNNAVEELLTENFINPKFDFTNRVFFEGGNIEIINNNKAILYEALIIEKYKYLNVRALSSSMGKYGDFEYLQYQKLEYDNKYKVAVGDMISPPIADTINKERLRDYPEGTLDPILLSYGITPAATELGKMYQLIIFRYEYAKNLYDIYLGFATDFRTKCRTLVELKEWGKIEQAFAMVDGLQEDITLEQIQNAYASFDAL